MGSAGAQAFWRTHGGFEMILITTAGQVLYNPGLSRKITPTEAAAMNTHPFSLSSAPPSGTVQWQRWWRLWPS